MKKVGTIVGPSFKIIVIKKMTYFAFILVNSFPVTRRAFSFAKASCGLLEKKSYIGAFLAYPLSGVALHPMLRLFRSLRSPWK